MLEHKLSVEPDEKTHVVRLRLTDQHCVRCGSHQVTFAAYAVSRWNALFNVERDAGSRLRDGTSTPDTAEILLDEQGVFLGTVVLSAPCGTTRSLDEPSPVCPKPMCPHSGDTK